MLTMNDWDMMNTHSVWADFGLKGAGLRWKKKRKRGHHILPCTVLNGNVMTGVGLFTYVVRPLSIKYDQTTPRKS